MNDDVNDGVNGCESPISWGVAAARRGMKGKIHDQGAGPSQAGRGEALPHAAVCLRQGVCLDADGREQGAAGLTG